MSLNNIQKSREELKRKRKVLRLEILLNCYKSQSIKDVNIRRDIQQKAQKIAFCVGNSEFQTSNGILENWLRRNYIK